MTERPVAALDANALEGPAGRRTSLLAELDRLLADGYVALRLPPGVAAEIAHPQAPAVAAQALLARTGPWQPARFATHADKLTRIRVRAVLRGDADGGRHEADAGHLCDAAEGGCRFFVTHDKRILGRRADLRALLPGLQIVTLERLVELVGGTEA